ncbi:SNF2 family N-terminal domain-containing protein [Xylaria arbuscula]|nr:SNF2 family N-terminal domain-containing protein [Xylaria arbuscula]
MLNNDMSNDKLSINSILKDGPLTDDMCIDAEIPIERQGNVCYGSLCDAKVKLKIPIMVNVSKPGIWDQYQEFELFQQNGVFHLRGNESQESIGVLDIASSRILKSLYNYSGITHTVILETQALKRLACIKTKSGNLDASINILGPENLFENVGDTITKAKGYLQHPFFLQMGTKYINPHWVYPHDVRTDLRHLIGPVSANYEDTRLSMGLVDIFQSLERSEMLGITPEDPIELLNLKKSLVTPLKHYQEEGVKHILTRENHEQAASAARILQGVIGHSAFKDRLIPLYGGIDADTMGLGKTLTMLSAIVCTIQLARDFVDSRKKVEKLPASRATLVITPSHQLIEVWSSEVKKHFTKSTLRIAVFHGSNRAKTESEIADNDIVLTTYNTLVADQKSGGLLQHIEWFRVVLDEAHYIRNNTSQQFKATCKLTATRRWCLSGTPISNSLEDLRSLLAFLRFRPFSEASFFRRHIIEPLGTDSTDQFRNLRMLMYAICFRRTADLLSLPLHLTEEVAITLSSREDEMYRKILAQSQKEYEKISTMKSSKKKYTVLFATTMQLRRLCNHGTFQQSSNTGTDSLKLDAQSKPVCEYCFADNADLGFASDTLIVCPECLRTLGHEFDAAPTYEQRGTATDSTDIALSLPHRVQTPSLSLFPSYSPSGGPMGCSTKLNVVVDNIQTTQISSKNLVFTSWRTTLDILQQLLMVRGIPCLRIDGGTPFANRQSILQEFCQNKDQTVLLLSIATGAVGLTLTAADRVHIVEPQWNPLVEEQAISRALRIGQTRSVTIFKYITKNTVEENIVSLQKRKMHLSRISLDGRGDHAGEKLEDFMFVLQQNGSRPRNDAADVGS